jgi:WD40 repeat protein
MPESQPANLRVVREIARQDILFSMARVTNSNRLLVASSEGKVLEVDAGQANGPVRELAQHGRYVTSVRLVGGHAVSGGYDGKLIWWEMNPTTQGDGENRGRVLRTMDAHTRWIRQIAVSPDGAMIASVADDMVCRLWNATTGTKVRELRGHPERTPANFASMLYACTFSADGRHLATGDRIGRVVVWEVATGHELAVLEAPTLYTWDGVQRIRSIGGVRGLAFSPDGTHLAVGGVGQINNVDSLAGPSRVEIFQWARRERVHEFTGPNGLVNRLQYHPQNRWLCAIGGGGNGLVMFHDPTRRTMIHQGTLPMHVHDLAFNEDFTTLYAVGHNKIVVAEMRG